MEQPTEYVVIVTTTDSIEVAQTISSRLVENRLCACAQIDSVKSVYLWDGKMENAQEHRIWLKTKKDQTAAVFEKIKSLHNYTTPQIIELPIDNIDPSYARWIDDVLKGDIT